MAPEYKKKRGGKKQVGCSFVKSSHQAALPHSHHSQKGSGGAGFNLSSVRPQNILS